MARYTGAVCRVCRREGMKLFLKGERCYTDKCAIERRNYAPGQHGMRHTKLSDYGVQLREKQKVKRLYGLQERQFKRYFKIAARKKGITGEALLQMLERRLDNVVYVLGFAESRNQARQLVRHHHFTINGKKANIPSIVVKEGDVVAVKEKSKKIQNVVSALESIDRRGVPAWLELNKEKMEGTVKSLPTRQDVTTQIQEQLIVELYSK